VYVAAYDRFNRPKMNLISENSLWSSANKKPGSSYWDAIKKKCCEAPSGFNDQRKVGALFSRVGTFVELEDIIAPKYPHSFSCFRFVFYKAFVVLSHFTSTSPRSNDMLMYYL